MPYYIDNMHRVAELNRQAAPLIFRYLCCVLSSERIYTISQKTQMNYLSYKGTCLRQYTLLPSARRTDWIEEEKRRKVLN